MFKPSFIILITLSNLPRITPCVGLYGQCGGLTYTGSTECCSPATCQYNNDYYSQCLTGTTAGTTKSTSTPSSSSTIRPSTGCNALYSQCGGQNWSGSTCCINSICVKSDNYYSQCLQTSSSSQQPTTASTSTIKASSSTTKSTASTTKESSSTTQSTASTTKASSSTTKSTASTAKTPVQGCSDTYGQCGGTGWTGPTKCCNSGSTCQFGNAYYSQCIPTPGASTSSSSTAKTASSSSRSTAQVSATSAINDGRVDGVTTRYWDCCKASCGWTGKASVTSPVKTCAKDGITAVNVDTQSGCNGGSAYMCNNQQPLIVSSTLSYGYAAAHISGQVESDWCCACYSLIFTTGPVIGKELIVQVTNTGGDLGNNHFDLQMPGGGVGIFNGCSSQFSGSYSWGNQYGGISQRSDCYNLPSVLLSGCLWRFDWFMNADNPQMRFKQVTCPTNITYNTQCIRK